MADADFSALLASSRIRSMEAEEEPLPLSPALTPAQRFHLVRSPALLDARRAAVMATGCCCQAAVAAAAGCCAQPLIRMHSSCPVVLPQETHGFVVVPSVLSEAENAALLSELLALRDSLAGGSSSSHGVTYNPGDGYAGLTNLLQCGGYLTGYQAHPRLVAMAEELVGGEVRCVLN
jgi:hypothetical protein